MRSAAFALALALPAASAAGDESRFDPPNSGAHLGVQIEELLEGPRVTDVLPGRPAARAGLRKGDTIIGIGEWKFRPDGPSLPKFLSDAPPQESEMLVRRDGETITIDIEPEPAIAATTREIARLLSSHRLFKEVEGGSLHTLEWRLTDAASKSKTRERAYERMNEIIDRFGLSHTAILTPWVSANLFGRGQHYHLGMFIQRLEVDSQPRYFVRAMMAGSPSRESALRVGDEIVAVNGHPFGNSPRRTLAGYEASRNIFTIQIDRDESIEIDYRRKQGKKVRRTRIKADRPVDAVASARQSVRLIGEKDAAKVGYIHFWNVMSPGNVEVLKEALEGEFAEAEAIAVDLRGRGGNVGVIAKIAEMLGNEERPIALLIDREARSAKEMLAFHLKGSEHITLVGETTAGAVLPASFVRLPGGAQLMLPVGVGDAGIRRFTRGVRLEGRGADPDIAVDSPLPYRAGKDPILNAAIRILRLQIRGKLLKV